MIGKFTRNIFFYCQTHYKNVFFSNIHRLHVVFILHATANKNNKLAEPYCSFPDCPKKILTQTYISFF